MRPTGLGTVVSVLSLIALSMVPVTMYLTHSPATLAAHSMTPFSSDDELQHFIFSKSCNGLEVRGLYNPNPAPQPLSGNGLATTASSSSSYSGTIPTHSETNAQVAGVDELDTVKNDGTYLYTVTNNTVAIVLAYPVVDAREVARLSVNGSIQGIFIDGSQLVIISQHFQYYTVPYTLTGAPTVAGGASMIAVPAYSYDQTSSIWVFDVSNHSSPILTTTIIANGTLSGARQNRRLSIGSASMVQTSAMKPLEQFPDMSSTSSRWTNTTATSGSQPANTVTLEFSLLRLQLQSLRSHNSKQTCTCWTVAFRPLEVSRD